MSTTDESCFKFAIFLSRRGRNCHRLSAGCSVRRGWHSLKRGDASAETVRIPQGARVGLEMFDALGGHEEFHAVEALFGLPFSVTGLLVWHV